MSHTQFAKTLILLLMTISLAAGCRSQESTASPVLLRVDNRTMTLEQYRSEFSKSLPNGQKLSLEERKAMERAFLAQIIDRELALAEADRLSIQLQQEELDRAVADIRREYPAGEFETMLAERSLTLEEWRLDLQKSLLMEKIIRQAVYTKVEVDDAEVNDYYTKHKDDFDRPAQVRARQIVVGSEDEGKQVLDLLRKGEAFADIARRFSLSPDADAGGDLGFFARNEMPDEFDAVVFSLPIGRISDLIKSEYGFHVFLVEEKRKAHRLTLDEAADEIRRQLLSEKEKNAHQIWLRNLRALATIEINWSLL
jgi:peptidyl-prolyl cis-trans isomerase C